MEKLAKATGGKMATNLNDFNEADLERAKLVEERKLGGDSVFMENMMDPLIRSLNRLFFMNRG